MKISYFYLAILIAAFSTICNAASVQNTTTCNCQDITRDSTIHNSLKFSLPKGETSCATYAEKIQLGNKVKGNSSCSVNGKSYPCSYEFTKVHPTSCTQNQ